MEFHYISIDADGHWTIWYLVIAFQENMLVFFGEVMVVLVMWWYPGSLEQHQGGSSVLLLLGRTLACGRLSLDCIARPGALWVAQWPVHFFFTAFEADFTWLPRRLWVKYLRSIKGNLFLTATTRFIRENLTWHISPKSSSSDQLSSALVHFLSVQHICGDLCWEEPLCLIITVSVVLSFLPSQSRLNADISGPIGPSQ